MKIINSHIHSFTEKDVPRKFLPLGLVRFLATKPGFSIVAAGLNFLNPLSKNNQFKKYLRFAEIGKLGSQENIALECAKYYPKGTEFIILAIDMHYMDAGKVPNDYLEQLDELRRLKEKYGDLVHPFVHVDPRRDGIISYIEANLNWIEGIKLYPPLGYFPYDERLMKLYDICEKNNLPIVAHCGPETPTYNRNSKKNIRKMLKGYPYNKKDDKQKLCSYFAQPDNYRGILEKHPNLNICLAHWGSECSWESYLKDPLAKDNWFLTIKEMMKTYPNLYTDISFTLNNQQYFSVLKLLLDDKDLVKKIMFGSDYYMVETKSEEKKFCIDLRAYLGEDVFKQIAEINPRTFLKK